MSYTTVAKQLIDRDYRVLRGLFESRVMTTKHIADLYFGGNLDTARKRIWKLKNANLVAERTRQRPYDASIVSLTRRAFEVLIDEKRLLDYPMIDWPTMVKRTNVSPLTLQHELDIMTVKAAITSAIGATGMCEIAEFSTWPRLFAFPARNATGFGYGARKWMKPDAFIRIRENDPNGFESEEHLFYLELDRSTEPQHRLQVKVGAYSEHYRSGGMAKRFGAPPQAYQKFPFRVLIVCRTGERRNNIAASMLTRHPPILTMVWLTTFDEVHSDALGPIWIRPIDYRDVTRNTSFDPSIATRDNSIYRRNAERDAFVRANIHRLFLLDIPTRLASSNHQLISNV